MKYIILLAGIILAVSFASAQDCSFRVSGHVVDADSRKALYGATIQIMETGRTVLTDSTGDFSFANTCPGRYTLLVSHIDCDSIQLNVNVDRNRHVEISLPHLRNLLGEIVIESRPGNLLNQKLSSREIMESSGSSLADIMERINGVTVLRTGTGIAKPVIHGLHSRRIITIYNGIRHEAQQWGNEHAPEIDPFSAGTFSLVKGVEELKYGVDAVGGTILVDPKPYSAISGLNGEFNTAFSTNNMQYLASAAIENRFKNLPLNIRLQGTIKKGSGYATPDYIMNNTGNEELNYSASAQWKKNAITSEISWSSYNASTGIFTGSHIGNLTDLQNAIAAEQPDSIHTGVRSYNLRRPYQKVKHDMLKGKLTYSNNGHRLQLNVGYQVNNRKEFDISRNAEDKMPQLDLDIQTTSAEAGWEQPWKNNLQASMGVSIMQQFNRYYGRYIIPNYDLLSYGGYYLQKWARHRWQVEAGIRAEQRTFDTRRLRINSDTVNYDFSFPALAASAFVYYKPVSRLNIHTGFTTYNRAPHVNELLSDGLHHGSATYEKGDPGLEAERSKAIFLGVDYSSKNDGLKVKLNTFLKYIDNFVYRKPLPDQPVLTIAGAFPQVVFKQTDAVLYGADAEASIRFLEKLEWNPAFSLLYAKDRPSGEWIIGMPPSRLSSDLNYSFSNSRKTRDSYAGISFIHVTEQQRVPESIRDYKEAPGAYNLLHFNASTTLNTRYPLTFSLTVNNVLNTSYRDYLNSMRYFSDEIGRNITIRIKIDLKKQHKH